MLTLSNAKVTLPAVVLLLSILHGCSQSSATKDAAQPTDSATSTLETGPIVTPDSIWQDTPSTQADAQFATADVPDVSVADSSLGPPDAQADSASRDLGGMRLTVCEGKRTNLGEDPAHCGRCGNVCPAYCSDGFCAAVCAAPLVQTGRVCLDPQTTRSVCGKTPTRSGDSCKANEVCTGGVCVVQCKSGETACGDACADLMTSHVHCGSCDSPCAAGTGCMLGACLTCKRQLPIVPQISAESPQEVFAGDMNHDGYLDLVTAGNGLGVFLGHGDGTFAAERTSDVTGSIYRAALVDLDGDGKLDVALTSGSLGVVTVLPGLGDGAFGSARTYPVPGAGELAFADLNRDGKLDLVVAGRSQKLIYVLLGTIGGGLAPTVSFATVNPANELAVGDLNGDGWPDVAVADSASNHVHRLFGNGDGTLASPRSISISTNISDLAIADLDADSQDDLIVVANGQLRVYRRAADGELYERGSGGIHVSPAMGPIMLADFNRDDRLDVLLGGGPTGRKLAILSSGFYGTALSPPRTFGLANVNGVAVGDFNKDGKLDVVAASQLANTLTLLPGLGDGSFSQPTLRAVGEYPQSLTFADLDADGLLDMVIPQGGKTLLGILRGLVGYGALENWVIPAGAGPVVAVADLDSDGKGDIVMGSSSKKVITFLLSGVGFSAPKPVSFERNIAAMVLGDWNGDGQIDLATSNLGSNDVTVVSGLGSEKLGMATHYPIASAAKQLFAFDINGDGKLDLLWPDETSKSVGVLTSVGNGTFTAGKPIDLGAARWVELGDFDGNGILDIAGLGNSTINVLLATGAGTFAPVRSVPCDTRGTNFSVGDLDGDGHADVLLPDESNRTMRFMLGNGDGTFGLLSPAYPLSIASGTARLVDLNRDGNAEVVFLDTGRDGALGILYGVKDCRTGS